MLCVVVVLISSGFSCDLHQVNWRLRGRWRMEGDQCSREMHDELTSEGQIAEMKKTM